MSCGPHNNKLLINRIVESTGIVGEYNLGDNDLVRFVVENANGSNTFIIRMKLKGQTNWVNIDTLSGSETKVVKTDTYEIMQIENTVLDGNAIRLLASGFRDE